MPRTLPWQTSGSSSTTAVRSKRPAFASTSIQKRQRNAKDSSVKDTSFSTEEEAPPLPRKQRVQGGKRNPDDAYSRGVSRHEEHPRSSSPPPSPPTERYVKYLVGFETSTDPFIALWWKE